MESVLHRFVKLDGPSVSAALLAVPVMLSNAALTKHKRSGRGTIALTASGSSLILLETFLLVTTDHFATQRRNGILAKERIDYCFESHSEMRL